MYGLEAINANNGWATSVVGITIVFSGLVVLSLVISQLYKALDLYENPQKIRDWFSRAKRSDKFLETEVPLFVLTEEQKEIIKQFALLVRTLEDHFSLPRLFELAQISGVKNFHSNLNILLKSAIIFPDKEGFFCWDQDMYIKTISNRNSLKKMEDNRK
ncbi:MAG: OadG family protein [Desulfobacteraceae bacterium]|nr:OadG family protein [Desulfobacteraceae bacterium]